MSSIPPLVNLPLTLPPPDAPTTSSSIPAAAASVTLCTAAKHSLLKKIPEEVIPHIVSFLKRQPNPLRNKHIERNNATNGDSVVALLRTCKSMQRIIQPLLSYLVVRPLLRPLQDDPLILGRLKYELIVNIRLGDLERVGTLWNELRKEVTTPGDIAKLVSVETVPIQLLCVFEKRCSAGCLREINNARKTEGHFHRGCWPHIISVIHDSGLTIAHVAASYGQDKILKVFLDTYPELTLQQDAYGLTPLYHAARRFQPNAIQTLLDYGADPTVCVSYCGDPCTPLSYAIMTADDAGEGCLNAMLVYWDGRKVEISKIGESLNIPKVLLNIIAQYDRPDFINEESRKNEDLFQRFFPPLSYAMKNYMIIFEIGIYDDLRREHAEKECSSRKKVIERLVKEGASPLDPYLVSDKFISILDAAKREREEVQTFTWPELLKQLDDIIALMEQPRKGRK